MKKAVLTVGVLLMSTQLMADVSKKAVLDNYANIALAGYSDSLATAKTLQASLKTLTNEPTDANLAAAKKAWKMARVPYQQTEVYRFGNAIVDDWEGKVNAWPLDEGLIDYVAKSYGEDSEDNELYTANVIANKAIKLSGKTIDANKITPALLEETLHEVGGVEANVATGYHAIEFLLWGQDLNGTNKGAGSRPVTDFDVKNCTGGNCERRNQYLNAAAQLLVTDLKWMVGQWQNDGAARQALLKDENAGISSIITGMGSLSYGELAGERIKLGVMLHDPEEEHDCFSDNTHNSHYYDVKGIHNVYTGKYTGVDGKVISGASLADLVAAKSPEASKNLKQDIEKSLAKAQALVDSAEKQGVAYDQLLGEGNKSGNAKIMALVDALLVQTKGIETAMNSLGLSKIEFEGSDALDSPSAVFQ